MPSVKRTLTAVFSAAAIALLASPPAHAQRVDRLALGGGEFDNEWMDKDKKMAHSAEFRADYRWGYSLLSITEPLFAVRPWAGIEVNTDGGVWGGGGFLIDATIGKYFYLSPSIGVGLYSQGDSKDLGSAIEFRSTFEAGVSFSNDIRLGAYVSHISSAGIDKYNPGVNMVGAMLSVPLTRTSITGK